MSFQFISVKPILEIIFIVAIDIRHVFADTEYLIVHVQMFV